MMLRRLSSAALLASVLGLSGAWAGAPEVSPRPVARGIEAEARTAADVPVERAEAPAEEATRLSSSGSLAGIRPRARPDGFVRATNPAARVAVVQATSRWAVARSPRPTPRPENHKRRAVVRAAAMIPTQPDPGAIIGKRGALCGDPAIRGEVIAPIAGRVKGCGLADGVRVREVDGVRLSTAATIDCGTAKALRLWVSETVKPTVGRLGGGVESLQVYAHYACRTRNNQKGAKISEHGRGRAIDIGAINLRNGAAISVLDHWRDDRLGRLLKVMHKGACGPFGTVLGPNADRFHQNHFHFDTARYRSGSYCR